MHSTDKTIDEIVESYPTVADHLRMSPFVSTNNETAGMGHENHSIINNNFLQKKIGSGGENVYVITSGHEILDIEDLPIPEVIIYDDFNKKNSIKNTLDLRQLVQQVNGDFSLDPITNIIEDKNDLLIKLSISATALKQDVVTVRLKDALVNNWYRELQVILNNAPMKISELELKPLPLIIDKNKEVIVVTSQDVEEKRKLIISKEAGRYTFLHSGYDLMITNVFNADMKTNKSCTICLKDFYKQPKMETLSIEFTDKKILLSDEMDQINNSDSFRDKLMSANRISQLNEKLLLVAKECNLGKIAHLVNHILRKPLAIDSSNQLEIAASSGTRPSLWINSCISLVKKLAASTFSIIPGLPAQYNIGDMNNVKSDDNNNIPQSISSIGWNKFINNENIALASYVADALDNTPSRRYQNLMSKGVEVVPNSKIAVEFVLRKFDSFVQGKIRNLGSKEQARIRVELNDAYPEITASLERGIEFSGNTGLDNVLKECKKSFCTNVLPKDKVSTCLSDVGATKLGNTLSSKPNIINGHAKQANTSDSNLSCIKSGLVIV